MRRYFITGLLIWVPLVITIWVVSALVGSVDRLLLWLPETYRPEHWLGISLPGIGLVFVLLMVFFTGLLTTNILGQRFVQLWEELLARIPVVKTIYGSVKQVSDTLFSKSGQAFSKVLLVRFPSANSWTVAFLTGSPAPQTLAFLDQEHVTVYVPTTPNPTSGYFLILPKNEVIELPISVDEALKYVVSMGVVMPKNKLQANKASK